MAKLTITEEDISKWKGKGRFEIGGGVDEISIGKNIFSFNINDDIKNSSKITKIDLYKADRLNDLDLSDSNIESITNVQAYLMELVINNCENIESLDLSTTYSEEYRQLTEQEAQSVFKSDKEAQKRFIERRLKSRLATLKCRNSSIQSIINIPRSLIEIDLSYSNIQDLDLSNAKNLKFLFCEGSQIRSITNIPDSLESINLSGCRNLQQTVELRSRLNYLEERGCKLILPERLRTLSADEIEERLERYNDNYSSVADLFNQYIEENIKSGTRKEQNVIEEVDILLTMIGKNPENLKWIKDISNNPSDSNVTADFNLIMSWMAVSQKESLSDKIEAVKRIQILDMINNLPMKEATPEARNLLFIEIYKELKEDGILKDDWIGVSAKTPCKEDDQEWVRKNIKNVHEKAKVILNSSKEDVMNFVNNTKSAGVKNTDVFRQIAFGNSPEIQKINEKYEKNKSRLNQSFTENNTIPDEFLTNIENQDENKFILLSNIFQQIEAKKNSEIQTFINSEIKEEIEFSTKEPTKLKLTKTDLEKRRFTNLTIDEDIDEIVLGKDVTEFSLSSIENGSKSNVTKLNASRAVGITSIDIYGSKIEEVDLNGLEKLGIFKCSSSSITSILNIPRSLGILHSTHCKNLKNLDLGGADRLHELDLSSSGIESITNIPISLDRLVIKGCENIKSLNLLQIVSQYYLENIKKEASTIFESEEEQEEFIARVLSDGLKELDCSYSSIESITNIPSSVEKINLNNCTKITDLDLSGANNLEDLYCSFSSIKSIKNIPPSVKSINLHFDEKITDLDLSGATGLEKLDCSNSSIKSITNLPDSLEEINLNNCFDLLKTKELELKFKELEGKGCKITLPISWGQSLYSRDVHDVHDLRNLPKPSPTKPELKKQTKTKKQDKAGRR